MPWHDWNSIAMVERKKTGLVPQLGSVASHLTGSLVGSGGAAIAAVLQPVPHITLCYYTET